MKSELLRYLVALTIASTLSILVTLAIRRGVRFVFGAAAAYSTWLFVPAAMLAALLPTPRNSGSTIGIPLRIDPVSTLSHALDNSLSPSLHTAASVDWTLWALGTWLVGAALSVLYLAGLQWAFVNSLGTLSGSRCVLRAQRSGGCPALLGVLRPKIVLPVDFESRYTRLERLLVFSHERTHLRRGDALWNAFVALMRCVFWFNPVVHLASTCFRVDQELACDAAVLRDFPRSRRTYATAMLKTQMVDVALPVGCNWQSAYCLKERLKMVKIAVPSHRRRTYGRICVVVASLVVGFSVWAAQPSTTLRVAVDEPAPNTQSAASTLAKYPVRISARGATFYRHDDFTQVTGAEIQLLIAPGVQVQFQSDRVSEGSGGRRTLEGHVSITATVSRNRASPTDTQPKIASASAMKAVVTPESGGGFKVMLENGSAILRYENGSRPPEADGP
jgi:beta-lactamase regulating signal transducer with metallopeptidase domain